MRTAQGDCGAGMTDWIGRLWRGEIGLARAFWEYTIVVGTLVQFGHDWPSLRRVRGRRAAVLAARVRSCVFLAAPYTFLVTVGCGAARTAYQGPSKWAHAARIGRRGLGDRRRSVL